jgi:hypothetical protein
MSLPTAPGLAAPALSPSSDPDATATTLIRWVVAISMPVGPLAIGVLRYLLPYGTTDSAGTSVQQILDHHGRETAVVWLFLVGVLALVPGVYSALRLAARGAPTLTAVAGLLLVPGYLAMYSVGLIDYIGITATPANVVSVASVADAVNALPSVVLLTVIFVIGHVLGTVLLAFALRKSGVLSRWPAVLLGVSQPIHFAAAMAGVNLIDLIGWCLTAVGMAFVAAELIRPKAVRS